MRRASFALGLAVSISALLGWVGGASAQPIEPATAAGAVVGAHAAASATAAQPAPAAAPAKPAAPAAAKGCVVNSLESFIDQGIEGGAGSVADIVEVECELSGPLQFDGSVTISNAQLRSKCSKLAWVVETKPGVVVIEETATVTVPLDADGNATVAIIGGPRCKPGSTEFVVDEDGFPDETYDAAFAIAPPRHTAEGIEALDPCPEKAGVCHSKVESDSSGSVFTILQVEFPVVEAKVAVNAEQILARCAAAPHAVWITGAPAAVRAKGVGRLEGATALETDDDGNAFVLLVGTHSCQFGKVKLEASLEAPPASSVFGEFLIESARSTI